MRYLNKKNISLVTLFLFVFAFFAFTACESADKFIHVDSAIQKGDYEEARKKLSDGEKEFYSDKDYVLRELDNGLLLHYAGQPELSNERLENAERLIEENYTKSISEGVASGIVNDTVKTYRGEFYEDIFINIFKCLNYIQLGKSEDAFVEIRRFQNKLAKLQHENDIQINAAKKALEENASSLPDMKVSFFNSSLADYLLMLMDREDDSPDNASLALRQIGEAYSLQKNIYDFAEPVNIDAEIQPLENGAARLNILSWTGLAPVKEEVVSRLFLPELNTYYKLALPVMVKRGSPVKEITVEIKDLADNNSRKISLEKIETVENIAIETYKNNYGGIFAKTLLRSIAKSVTTTATGTVGDGLMSSKNSDEAHLGVALKFLSWISMAVTEATERADIRTSRFFPADAYVGGIALSPGSYDIAVTYRGMSGILGTQTFSGVEVSRGKFNLLESVCLERPAI